MSGAPVGAVCRLRSATAFSRGNAHEPLQSGVVEFSRPERPKHFRIVDSLLDAENGKQTKPRLKRLPTREEGIRC